MQSVLWLFPKVAAIMFAIAGFYFFADPAPLAKLMGDWVRGPNFNRVFGAASLLAAALFPVSRLQVGGAAVAAFVLFGTTVALLERKHYLYTIPGIVMLGALPLTVAAG